MSAPSKAYIEKFKKEVEMRKAFLILLSVIVYFLLSPLTAFAGGDLAIQELKLRQGGKKIPIEEKVNLREGEKINISFALVKLGFPEGQVQIISELEDQQGLLRFNLKGYKKVRVPVQIEGRVPRALIRQGDELIQGRREFVLLNVIWVNGEKFKQLEFKKAFSTNEIIKKSERELAEFKRRLNLFRESPFYGLAEEILICAEKARPKVVPILCETGNRILDRKGEENTGREIPPIIIAGMFVLALLALAGWLSPRLKQGKQKREWKIKAEKGGKLPWQE